MLAAISLTFPSEAQVVSSQTPSIQRWPESPTRDTAGGSFSAPFAAPSLLMDPHQPGATLALNSESSVGGLTAKTEGSLGLPATQAAETNALEDHDCGQDSWEWQTLPDGLVYRSYLAGFKEPRMHSLWAQEQDLGWIWDIALGGRVGLLRYGNHNNSAPDGWQLDLEGAAFPRLDPEEERDLVAVDFRAGAPLTFGRGPYRAKLAYYHLSSHLGDEFLLKNPTVTRYNYSREVLVLGQAYYVHPDWRVYGEAGWAFYADVGGEWEFQFGIEYSPTVDNGHWGSPFAAFNGHLREEVSFGGNLVAQTGWQWRQVASGHLLRVGLEYYNGQSDQFEFFNRYENKIGVAIWYDY